MHYLITCDQNGQDSIVKVNALPNEMGALKAGDMWAGLPIIQIEQIQYTKCLVGPKDWQPN